MARRFAIPDIHGCVMTFGILLDEVLKIKKDDTVYLLGDYIDRGPDSKGVLDRIMRMIEAGYDIQPLKGNHDEWLCSLHAKYIDAGHRQWCINGGDSTLKSFQVSLAPEVDTKYINFLNSLPIHIELDDYVLVHGGLNFYLKDPVKGTSDNDKMWERPYGEHSLDWPLGEKKVIVGHTVRNTDQVRKYIEENANVLMIDNGCVFKSQRNKGLGNLSAFNLDTREIVFQANIDEEYYY